MTHSLNEINEYTGFLTGVCALCLFFCVRILSRIQRTLVQMYLDYRKVNSLDEREELESEASA